MKRMKTLKSELDEARRRVRQLEDMVLVREVIERMTAGEYSDMPVTQQVFVALWNAPDGLTVRDLRHTVSGNENTITGAVKRLLGRRAIRRTGPNKRHYRYHAVQDQLPTVMFPYKPKDRLARLCALTDRLMSGEDE